MTKLSVNINKIATIRNARGGSIPDVIEAAKNIENFGAEGITIHPRPDQRHITFEDVYNLKKVVTTEYNIEGYPSEHFIKMVLEVKPTQVTLVPDPPNVLTSNAGWDTLKHQSFLTEIVAELNSNNIRSSIFMDTDKKLIEIAKKIGSNRIELYTERYAMNYNKNKKNAIEDYKNAAQFAHDLKLGVNAGHDLDLNNLAYFAANIPHLSEVSIGHALISDSLYLGLQNAVTMYKSKLKKA